MDAVPNETLSLDAKIDLLTERVDLLLERQRAISELIDESGPILDAVMQAGTQRLGEMEEAGYFAFGRSALRLLDRVATSYGADDVDQLGDAVVGILDTVRNVTQPDVLSVANDATDVLHHADELEPVGVMGALKKSRDDDVQRGIAVALEVLRHVGKAAKATSSSPGKRRLARHLAPQRRTGTPRRAQRPRPVDAAPSAPAPVAQAAPASFQVPGFELDSDGFLVNPLSWTRDFADAMAALHGIDTLTAEHWQVVDYMRGTFVESGISPNIRKVAKGGGICTREIYQLFKKAPGKTAARIAGIPKPVGCI